MFWLVIPTTFQMTADVQKTQNEEYNVFCYPPTLQLV